MKAQILPDYGDADRFVLTEVPTPDPGPGQVRVRVRDIGLNPMEVKLRNGSLREEIPTTFPAILGTDMSGIVDALGDEVTGLAVGGRVVGLAQSGAYAEYAVTRADLLAPIPDALDFERAATLPTASETAQRVIALLEPEVGETVVVNGAAGSVGSAAVQLLVRAGVRVVGTASKQNHDYVRGLGAEPTTYGDGVVERIRALAPHGVHAVFDVTGHGFADAAIELRGGAERVVTISDFSAAERGVTVSAGVQANITSEDFAPVLELAAAGEFVTEVAARFAFEDIAGAHRLSEQSHLRGKIVVAGAEGE